MKVSHFVEKDEEGYYTPDYIRGLTKANLLKILKEDDTFAPPKGKTFAGMTVSQLRGYMAYGDIDRDLPAPKKTGKAKKSSKRATTAKKAKASGKKLSTPKKAKAAKKTKAVKAAKKTKSPKKAEKPKKASPKKSAKKSAKGKATAKATAEKIRQLKDELIVEQEWTEKDFKALEKQLGTKLGIVDLRELIRTAVTPEDIFGAEEEEEEVGEEEEEVVEVLEEVEEGKMAYNSITIEAMKKYLMNNLGWTREDFNALADHLGKKLTKKSYYDLYENDKTPSMVLEDLEKGKEEEDIEEIIKEGPQKKKGNCAATEDYETCGDDEYCDAGDDYNAASCRKSPVDEDKPYLEVPGRHNIYGNISTLESLAKLIPGSKIVSPRKLDIRDELPKTPKKAPTPKMKESTPKMKQPTPKQTKKIVKDEPPIIETQEPIREPPVRKTEKPKAVAKGVPKETKPVTKAKPTESISEAKRLKILEELRKCLDENAVPVVKS